MSSPDPDQFTTPLAITPSLHRDPYPAISPENNPATGKIILVVGASSGIGAAAAKVWARAGAEGIIITGRRQSLLDEVAKEVQSISPSSAVLPIAADSTSEAEVKAVFTAIQKQFGRHADVVLNSAGYVHSPELPIGEEKTEDFWKGFVSHGSLSDALVADNH